MIIYNFILILYLIIILFFIYIDSTNIFKLYYISKSNIKGAGYGVFAKNDIPKNKIIGKVHDIILLNEKYIFTELGKYHNHSNNPNVINIINNNSRYLKALRNIKKNEEILSDYRLQPDLEQPLDNWN